MSTWRSRAERKEKLAGALENRVVPFGCVTFNNGVLLAKANPGTRGMVNARTMPTLENAIKICGLKAERILTRRKGRKEIWRFACEYPIYHSTLFDPVSTISKIDQHRPISSLAFHVSSSLPTHRVSTLRLVRVL